jgi:hypothetical protein
MMRRRRAAAALALCAVAALGILSRDSWLAALGRTLVCTEGPLRAEAIILDNFDNEYRLFARGAELQRTGLASRVVVPVTFPNEKDAAAAAREVANAFARLAGLLHWDLIPVDEREPISLNAAYEVRDFLLREHVTSVTLVSSGFRSRRSELIYRSVLSERGVTTECLPMFGSSTPETWTSTWHGIQDVGLQFLKLQYYRFWVLPRASEPGPPR